jgi:hypothetical protein
MSDQAREKALLADPRKWGFMSDEQFIALPKVPMILGGYGPPPFDVTLPSGQIRHVIAAPDGDHS